MKSINKYVILSLISILLFSCESPCERSARIDGPAFAATFVYNFPEGKDLSNNVMVLYSYGKDIEYVEGYRPIPLHKGFYLDGPIPQVLGDAADIFYMNFTYEELENGDVPSDWKENWKNYLVPCSSRSNNYFPWEILCYMPYSPCSDGLTTTEVLRNDTIFLHTPLPIDVHVDTNILNKWIDNDELRDHLAYRERSNYIW